MQRSYHLDTNILLDNPNAIEILRNGEENEINISMDVINEIDVLIKKPRTRNIAISALENIIKNKEFINFTGDKTVLVNNDDKILNTVSEYRPDNPVFVSNDKLLRLKAYILGIECERFNYSIPFLTDSQKYTGFIDFYKDDKVKNCFYFKDGIMFFHGKDEDKRIDYENMLWKVKPKDCYQNATMEMVLNDKINLMTIQAKAGVGKSYLALAGALQLVLEKKKFKKIIIIKPTTEIGESLGYLPGNLQEKLQPHWMPMYRLLLKLHHQRPCNKIWIKHNEGMPEADPKYLEFLPINYLRGMNIDNAFVIIDEAQNISRLEMRSILTRMGKNVKVICEGDVTQVDHPKCNTNNNGLNWILRKMKGYQNYGHITMNCKTTRGPICDLVVDSGL